MSEKAISILAHSPPVPYYQVKTEDEVPRLYISLSKSPSKVTFLLSLCS